MTVLDFTAARRARLLAELDAVLLEHPDIRLDGNALVLEIDDSCLTQCSHGDMWLNMARQREEDRANVTARGKGYVAMRLTPNEVQALADLVAIEQASIDEAGQVHRASQSSVLRALLRREAIACGVWPDADVAGLAPQKKEPEPTPPAPDPVPEAPKPEPIETKPEPEPEPAAELELDADDIRKRLQKGLKKGKWASQDALADAATKHLPEGAAPIKQSVVSRFVAQNKGTTSERLAAFAATLREVGLL